jgi:hypothetical protein
MAQSELPREELAAAVEARRELGQELEPQVIDSFLEKMEKAIDARVDQRVRERLPAKRERGNGLPYLAIVSLCVAIPMLGIAGGTAGLAGVVVVCTALVLLNLVVR